MITFHIYIFLFISSKWQWAGYIVRRKQSSRTETADRLANLRTSTNKMTDGFPVDANYFQPRQLDVYGRGVQQLTSIGWYDDYYNIPFHIRVHKERSTYDVVIEKKKVYIYLVCQFSNLNQSSQKKCINQKWKSVLKRGTEIFRHISAYRAVAIRSQSKHSLGIRMSHLCQTWPAFGMKLHIIYISRGMSLRYASLHFANGWLSVLYEGFNICFVRNITFFDVWWFMT